MIAILPTDGFGRRIDYLRISLTDHCNLRCIYCMPVQGLTFVPTEDLLTPLEIARVAATAIAVGFRKIRFTGGEPTLRSDLIDIVSGVRRGVGSDVQLCMTTNAILLPGLAHRLKEAGLDRVNIHVDSLDADNLQRVMRFGNVVDALRGIEAAEEADLTPIKLNCVVVRDYNDQDVVELARRTLHCDWHVRFIELMPLGGGQCARVALSQFVPTSETRARIERALGPLTPEQRTEVPDESCNFRFEGAPGVVGFISPVSEPYCDTCNRMRLTADGRFHLCLLRDEELDVRRLLRSGGTQEDLRRLLLRAIHEKPIGHRLHEGISSQDRAMFQIGG